MATCSSPARPGIQSTRSNRLVHQPGRCGAVLGDPAALRQQINLSGRPADLPRALQWGGAGKGIAMAFSLCLGPSRHITPHAHPSAAWHAAGAVPWEGEGGGSHRPQAIDRTFQLRGPANVQRSWHDATRVGSRVTPRRGVLTERKSIVC